MTKKQAGWIVLYSMCAILFVNSSVAQDPHFSQFYKAPLLRNPSLAGIFDGDVRVQTVFRSQWGTITTPYQTGSLSAEYKLPVGKSNDYITTGLQMLYDRAGTINFTTTQIFPAVNYHKALSDDKTKYLSLGFMGGFVQRSIDRSKITTNNEYDGNGYNPSLGDGEVLAQNKYTYPDGSVGMSFNSSIGDKPENNYYIGLAYHHFNRPKNSFYKDPSIELKPKWQFSTGVKLSVNDNTFVTMYGEQSIQGPFSESIAGAMYAIKLGNEYDEVNYVVQFGGFMRWHDAFIPVIQLDYSPWSITVSYDANISDLKTASQTASAFELSVSFAAFTNRYNSTRNAVMCPRF